MEEHGAVKHIVNSIVGRRKYILNGQFGKAMQKHVMEEIKEASRKEGNEMPLHVKNLTRKVLAHFGEHDKPAPKEEKKVVNHVGRTAPGCVPGAPVQNRVTSISDISRGDSNLGTLSQSNRVSSINDLLKRSGKTSAPTNPSPKSFNPPIPLAR
ncbi:MAG: hypothetical protein UX39_C0010G0008 [Candidatus Magasanikbacteria bacterium GW2011_GWA2_46_17]|uniref:Uncharacterized protein n=1 Tax=Candidatus Magasanikbacteria bacterium GW2011_GWA2_46_17 TaxID=1619042 RepID=A0A0G1P0P5_9BACT|nr:MAG: hypothetical protein UX39_C0010G0008 [Candidatus Magasanikbacteria bacterium GW2011_GWA2_46_17]